MDADRLTLKLIRHQQKIQEKKEREKKKERRERGRTGLFCALDNEVVDHDAYEAVRAGDDEGRAVERGEARVDACYHALPGCFLVPGGT